MKIYTKTGDDGHTHLSSGPRVAKNDPHVEACGTVDELNAVIGMARSRPLPADIDQLLERVQHELFRVGADLALRGPATGESVQVGDKQVNELERDIDRYEAELTPLAQFILPGGTRAAATLHLARTVCRRAERRVVSLVQTVSQDKIDTPTVRFLNRLSDLLFVLPRVLNARANVADVVWNKGKESD